MHGGAYVKYCLEQTNYTRICMGSDIIYPDYVDSVASVGGIRGLLFGVNRDPWAQVGEYLECPNLV